MKMAMQYLAGSIGVYTPSNAQVELVYDTCSECKFAHVKRIDDLLLLPTGFKNKPIMVLLGLIRFTDPKTEDFQGT